MSEKWSLIHASGVGKREYNDDFVATKTFSASRRRYFVLVACDGVGSDPGSGVCAEAVSLLSADVTETFIKERGTHRTLDDGDAEQLARVLETQIALLDGSPNHSTTICTVVFDGESLVGLWAGDTRAYCIDVDANLVRLTQEDHHDDEGRLTRFVTGDGHIEGGLERAVVRIPREAPLAAVTAITDGVHGACSFEDLRQLLGYLAHSQPHSERTLDQVLREFLGQFMDDNYSIAIFLRRLRKGYVNRLIFGIENVA